MVLKLLRRDFNGLHSTFLPSLMPVGLGSRWMGGLDGQQNVPVRGKQISRGNLGQSKTIGRKSTSFLFVSTAVRYRSSSDAGGPEDGSRFPRRQLAAGTRPFQSFLDHHVVH